MSGMRTVLASIGVFGLVGVGYGMWAIISPGEDRKREILKNLPEANPVRMEETRKRNALMLQVLKDAAETNDNIARGYGGQK
ncbi:ubiquinol-cytochrome-c reductase complex assembly factor 3-like [Sinocyclocheilus anshuiensis]|uniref:Ubiquinol-cytochrome-c reductase complex assembly factor 3 n=1 Tax=Sinocyclocheilus anshuiensis TaxID=1608454 RepID=A0A671RLL7_9TELE|nr:PREDICTED: ubiquinol-cytochrome-c reductase complex assembly factor 3-like [Sinocyclocheilus anshuiensis]